MRCKYAAQRWVLWNCCKGGTTEQILSGPKMFFRNDLSLAASLQTYSAISHQADFEKRCRQQPGSHPQQRERLMSRGTLKSSGSSSDGCNLIGASGPDLTETWGSRGESSDLNIAGAQKEQRLCPSYATLRTRIDTALAVASQRRNRHSTASALQSRPLLPFQASLTSTRGKKRRQSRACRGDDLRS